MAIDTAFGRESDYQNFVNLGCQIAQSKNSAAFNKQIKLLTSGNKVESQRAATVLHHVSNHAPDLFLKAIPHLIQVLINPIHDSGPRMALRVFSLIEISDKYSGTIIDQAFKYLNNPKTPVAIKVNALYTIAGISKRYPELTRELEVSISKLYLSESYSFKASVRNISKKLDLNFGGI